MVRKHLFTQCGCRQGEKLSLNLNWPVAKLCLLQEAAVYQTSKVPSSAQRQKKRWYMVFLILTLFNLLEGCIVGHQ